MRASENIGKTVETRSVLAAIAVTALFILGKLTLCAVKRSLVLRVLVDFSFLEDFFVIFEQPLFCVGVY